MRRYAPLWSEQGEMLRAAVASAARLHLHDDRVGLVAVLRLVASRLFLLSASPRPATCCRSPQRARMDGAIHLRGSRPQVITELGTAKDGHDRIPSQHLRVPHRSSTVARLGGGGRRADHAGPGGLVRRLRRGVARADRPAGRRGHPGAAEREPEAELVLGPHRPVRCGARRGAHLHLLRRPGRRRPDQQLDGPGRDEGDA